MNAPLRTTITSTLTASALKAAFAQIPEETKAQAARLGIEILWNDDGFGMWVEGDTISGNLTAEEVQIWLNGFDCGHDSVDVSGLLSELVAAEQIIQTMGAQMSDAQRLAACESLIAVGFPVDGAARCQPRRAAIAAARKAGVA